MLRVGSFALASAGSTRKAQVAPFGLSGRSNVALKRMLAMGLGMAGIYQRRIFASFWSRADRS